MTANTETEYDITNLVDRAAELVEARDRYLIADAAYMDEVVRLYEEGLKLGTIAKDGPIAYPALRARVLKITQA